MANDSEKKDDGSSCGCGGGSCCSGSGKWIWIVLALAVVGVLIARNADKKNGAANDTPATVVRVGTQDVAVAGQRQALPRLIDLGATKCIPCKMMAPILEDLKKTYAGKIDVQFIDVWENPDAGKKYGINVIPTQIFYDAQGKELFRHEGFYGKEDILTKWKELGVELGKDPESRSQKSE
jgi:thioredoxin 1